LQRWKLTKKLLDFKQFFDELYSLFPTYSHIIPFIEDEWLDHPASDHAFYTVEVKSTLQGFMTDLSSIPFIRENLIFK
jgi:hypothetical protein